MLMEVYARHTSRERDRIRIRIRVAKIKGNVATMGLMFAPCYSTRYDTYAIRLVMFAHAIQEASEM